TKSGIMLGLGESLEQVQETLRDMRAHDVEMVTIGQYLQPSPHHHPVTRYWTPEEYKALEVYGMGLGFTHVASGPLVRSSYHADRSAAGAGLVATASSGPSSAGWARARRPAWPRLAASYARGMVPSPGRPAPRPQRAGLNGAPRGPRHGRLPALSNMSLLANAGSQAPAPTCLPGHMRTP